MKPHSECCGPEGCYFVLKDVLDLILKTFKQRSGVVEFVFQNSFLE